jgi:hypothetical protein
MHKTFMVLCLIGKIPISNPALISNGTLKVTVFWLQTSLKSLNTPFFTEQTEFLLNSAHNLA